MKISFANEALPEHGVLVFLVPSGKLSPLALSLDRDMKGKIKKANKRFENKLAKWLDMFGTHTIYPGDTRHVIKSIFTHHIMHRVITL